MTTNKTNKTKAEQKEVNDNTLTKSAQGTFKFVHPVSGDIFIYKDKGHSYTLNGVELPGTTTPLKLVNELSWDDNGRMTDKSQIIQQWAIKLVANEVIEKTKDKTLTGKEIEEIVIEAKKAPNKSFTGAGVSGTEIHSLIEQCIKYSIQNHNGIIQHEATNSEAYELPQVKNFVDWATKNNVKFLFSEEPVYSKDWMNCGTVDFVCEINGKILVGDIKTNGDKRKYYWDDKLKKYDYSRPQSNIHTVALWQTGCYAKMITESNARKLLDKVDGVVIVNIMKGGEFDEKLDVRYDYNVESLIQAFDYVIKLYRLFVSKIK